MKNLPRLLLALAIAATSVLSAQTTASDPTRGPRREGPGGPGGHGGPGRGPSGGHPVIRVLDANRDHEISAAEIAGASAALLTLDANKDGAVAADELHPPRPARPTDAPARPTAPAGAPSRGGRDRPHPVSPVMLALDANTDGALSANEIANAARSLAAIDANKDGKLSTDELRPLPPAE